jgi:D-glycero-alpha-D-manno-heptose-7-phosphate kinase
LLGDELVITTRTPLRITFGGGGSDLAPGGFCVSATINQYITVSVSQNFEPTYVMHYSQAETATHPKDIQHRLLRKILLETRTPPGIQISTSADIPAGTGLGSSGAFTVGLLRALFPMASKPLLARLACRMDIGQQDQWSAVYGGVNIFDFRNNAIRPIETTIDSHLELYYTGIKHDAGAVLTGQHVQRRAAVHQADLAVKALEANDPKALGECLTAQWYAKFKRSPTRCHQLINGWIKTGIEAGAHGGKLIGAGDGGFILFATDTPLSKPMRELGLRHVPFKFSHEGSKCM